MSVKNENESFSKTWLFYTEHWFFFSLSQPNQLHVDKESCWKIRRAIRKYEDGIKTTEVNHRYSNDL